MTNTISSQIDNRNFVSMPRLENATPHCGVSFHNKGSEQNFITRREARHLADFFVTPSRSRVYSFEGKPRNQTQGRSLQLGRILY